MGCSRPNRRSQAAAVLDVGRRHRDGQQQAEAVHPDMPLAAADLLAAVVAGLSAHFGGLDRLAVHGGGGGRRMARRPGSGLAAARLLEVLPRAVVAPLAASTACGRYSRAEKSLGNSRHWQPVRTKYRMPLTTRRRSAEGRPVRQGRGRKAQSMRIGCPSGRCHNVEVSYLILRNTEGSHFSLLV